MNYMQGIKILHCADLHIGAGLITIGSRARKRRAEILMAFDRIIEECRRAGVQALLIAGDLFDGVDVRDTDISHMKERFASIPDTIVAISPGNHDSVSEDSCYMSGEWPSNVLIFRGGMEHAEFPDLGLRLWGAGFGSTYVDVPLLPQASVPQDDFINICVLHGDLVGKGQKSNYNPVSVEQIAASGMDYIALGHVHKRTEVLKAGKTSYAYSGCPEGLGFDESGEKGIYMGTVDRNGTSLEFRPICARMYIDLEVDISGKYGTMETVEAVIRKMKEAYGEAFRNHLYKVVLTGNVVSEMSIDLDAIKARLEPEVFFVKMRNRTELEIDLAETARENSLKGIFVRKMLEQISLHQDRNDTVNLERCRTALNIGLKAFNGEVMYHED